ncbi:MAG: hypothetical protein M3R24_00820 [Chloroflexota bacterium]|nr:hypothetical protein [Chloroflexota bacterium]
MRRTATPSPDAEPVHEPPVSRPSTVQAQIAASRHQRQAARQILAESRRLSELTRQRLAQPPRGVQGNHQS